MRTAKYIYWQEEDAWLGYLEVYPDWWTRGETFDGLIESGRGELMDIAISTRSRMAGLARSLR